MKFEHLSRLTNLAAAKVREYAVRYDLELRGGFSSPGKDTIYFVLYEPSIIAHIHCTPYGYLCNLIIDGTDNEIYIAIRNIRTFFSRVRRLCDGDRTALL